MPTLREGVEMNFEIDQLAYDIEGLEGSPRVADLHDALRSIQKILKELEARIAVIEKEGLR